MAAYAATGRCGLIDAYKLMTLLAGVDGCDYGWICITNDLTNGTFSSQLFETSTELLNQTPKPTIYAINLPIGLSESGPRKCDILAMDMLNHGRRKSVFDAPVRPALNAQSHKEATEIQSSITGRGLNLFTWSQVPKIIDVDHQLQKDAEMRKKVFETHSEFSLLTMNGRKRIEKSKGNPTGESMRRELVDKHFGSDAFESVRQRHFKKECLDRDIIDAFAALWTAERIYKGVAKVIPEEIRVDSEGLRMGMWV